MSPISKTIESSDAPIAPESEPQTRTGREGVSGTSDSKQSLQHILTDSEPRAKSSPRSQSQMSKTRSPEADTPPKQPIIWIDGEVGGPGSEDQFSTQNDSYTRASEFNPSHTMTVAHTRRNANGTIGSVYSGNKIKHLKKEDGIPLWRSDIQLEFLRCVFDDETACFTKAFDGTKNHTFADIYVDAMARSSKTSKILKEKLLADRAGAMSMAMICLLVNVGRMNTTLNFFPEMRAQLRTYHAIPSLQANQDPNAYKQLQDAPRLKSILKGASEDNSQPSTIDRIKAAPVPRTNPVNLIFVLSQYAPKVSETHFHAPRDFFDLVMRGTLSSKSRAKAFLWLIWWYSESDFTAENALKNPFGPGQPPTDKPNGMPVKVPRFEHLTEEQASAENVDTESEIAYGEVKRLERRRILEEDETVGPPMKKNKKSEEGVIAISDTDPTRSPSPASAIHLKSSMDYNSPTVLNGRTDETVTPTTRIYPAIASKSDTSNPQRLVLKTRMDSMLGSSPPAPPGSGHPVLGSNFPNGHRRARPETSHQKAVNMNRKMRIDHILHNKMKSNQVLTRREKRRYSSSFGFMVMSRVQNLPEMYDSGDEETSWGPGGVMPNQDELEDWGEEAIRHKKVVDRAVRRLLRAENEGLNGRANAGPRKKKRKVAEYHYEENTGHISKKRKRVTNNGARDVRSQDEGLDDLDLDLLGENPDEDDSAMDGSEIEAGAMTEEEMYD